MIIPYELDCEWGPYDNWSSCPKTCGKGYMSRSRLVSVNATNGGKECKGEARDTKSCNEGSCPGNFVFNPFHKIIFLYVY